MKTTLAKTSSWAPITKVTECLGCSITIMHKWGRNGRFGYKQVGPRMFIVCVPEVLAFYTERYPNIAINLEEVDAAMQSTA